MFKSSMLRPIFGPNLRSMMVLLREQVFFPVHQITAFDQTGCFFDIAFAYVSAQIFARWISTQVATSLFVNTF